MAFLKAVNRMLLIEAATIQVMPLADDPDAGNEWQGCTVYVEASYAGLIGKATMRGCSYPDQESFERDIYFEPLRDAALADLARKIEDTRRALRQVMDAVEIE